MTTKDINSIFDNDKNGANLENKVAKILKEAGWEIKENQPYIDPNSDKQREIDIIAIKKYLVGEKHPFINEPEILEMRLFIDCKNLPNGAGLYIQERNDVNIYDAYMEKRAYNELYSEYFKMNNDVPFSEKNHRYFTAGKIAHKSINNDERSIGFQGANQVINAMFSKFYSSYETWNIDYPIIVVNNVNQIGLEEENGNRFFASENLLYGIDSIPDGKEKRYFIIDIVGLDLLKGFLDKLEIEFTSLNGPIFQNLLHKKDFEEENNDPNSDWNSIYS